MNEKQRSGACSKDIHLVYIQFRHSISHWIDLEDTMALVTASTSLTPKTGRPVFLSGVICILACTLQPLRYVVLIVQTCVVSRVRVAAGWCLLDARCSWKHELRDKVERQGSCELE